MSNEDLKYVIAGARKLFCFNLDAGTKAISKGPRITEPDADFTKSLKVRNGMATICRQNTASAKVFDITSGKEVKKQITSIIVHLLILFIQYCVVRCQEMKGKKAIPPTDCNDRQ